MNRDVTGLLGPLVAVVLLVVVLTQTAGALRVAGAFGSAGKAAAIAADDPYVLLDRRLAESGTAPRTLRNPFSFGASAAPAPARVTGPRRPVVPPPPPRPVLTAIVFDADPRAIVRWNDREWTLRAGALFDEFRVVSIARDRVVLQRGTETLVLTRQPGEQP